jgi:hypothetical protein
VNAVATPYVQPERVIWGIHLLVQRQRIAQPVGDVSGTKLAEEVGLAGLAKIGRVLLVGEAGNDRSAATITALVDHQPNQIL